MFEENDFYDDIEDGGMIVEELILENCHRYINRIRTIYETTGNRLCFKRGSAKVYNGGIETFKPRRKPMNTSVAIHTITNDWFGMKFGVKAREECLFVTNSTLDTKQYGTPHYVFPVGGFSTIHSNKINDLFLTLNTKTLTKVFNKYGIDTSNYTLANKEFLYDLYIKDKERMEMAIYEIMDSGDYKKGRTTESLLSNNEIMLVTKKFIMVPIDERFSAFINEVAWY